MGDSEAIKECQGTVQWKCSYKHDVSDEAENHHGAEGIYGAHINHRRFYSMLLETLSPVQGIGIGPGLKFVLMEGTVQTGEAEEPQRVTRPPAISLGETIPTNGSA